MSCNFPIRANMCPGRGSNSEPLTLVAIALSFDLSGRHPSRHNIRPEQPFDHDIWAVN